MGFENPTADERRKNPHLTWWQPFPEKHRRRGVAIKWKVHWTMHAAMPHGGVTIQVWIRAVLNEGHIPNHSGPDTHTPGSPSFKPFVLKPNFCSGAFGADISFVKKNHKIYRIFCVGYKNTTGP